MHGAHFLKYAHQRTPQDGRQNVSDNQTQGKTATVIKKYANRRLYNTATSTYVTLDDLAAMVKNGTDFLVYDAKTGEDITRSVLTQIIFEEENKGGAQNMLPVNFLRQLIKAYGDTMQGLVPGYLEFSLDNLMKDQEKYRKQMMDAAGMGEAFKGLEDHAKRNMTMFNDAMKLFNPFAAMMSGAGAAAPPETPNAASAPAASKDDFELLKSQLAAMQQKLDKMSN
ncbi:MAG: polyhydroxyalkanoate synthesis repressor PhaR [Alphaproteobacteria bacterium]|nr:polyhydroxyalkanoate synthesis repressor PhaR [Alphaproteobacteria bacterium]